MSGGQPWAAAGAGETGHRIHARSLSKRFGTYTAVDDVSVSLGGEGATALIGPNGAGKTTVFNLITGQMIPDEGTILLDGKDVTRSPPYKMAQYGVARGFQDVRLFGGLSVLANVMVYAQQAGSDSILRTIAKPWRQAARTRHARELAEEILDYLGVARIRHQRADSLGFAEQKLVAIARVLALRPRILFLDEPASGLDAAEREKLAETIRRLCADGLSICFVEHNTHMVRELATRVLFLSQGRILADGPTDVVFSHTGLAEAYLGIA